MRKIGDAIAAAVYAAMLLLSLSLLPGGGDTLVVRTDDGEYAFSLSENGIHSFTGPLGTTEIEIKDGRARVISSPCRNRLCIESGWSENLCCLPNRIIATASGGEGDLDAVAG